MPSLLSGSVLRSGGSGDFINLVDAQPQLPATDTTETGFTIATDAVLRTTYRSSLGFVHFHTATMYSILPEGQITVIATGTTIDAVSTSTASFVVQGGVGIGRNLIVEEDARINGVRVGTGDPEPGWTGQNNIVVRGTATTSLNEFLNGQKSIAIGYDVLGGLNTAYKSIAIGTFALNSGTKLANNIAIGDSALKELGWRNANIVATITNATVANPVVITAPAHNLSTGTNVVLDGISGMTELNAGEYYINVLSTDTFALYSDSILSTTVDGNLYTPYASGGTVGLILIRRNNIAIGNNAAQKLQDGEKNFFFGDLIAKNLVTGSNNIFIGSDVGANLTKASGTISIGSDNLVDNRNNQVAIGSVFYYDGTGTATVNANTEIGIGQQSTGTSSGGLRVIGGAGIERNLYVGENFYVVSTGTSSYFAGNIVPTTANVSLGNPANPFKALYVSGSTLYIGEVELKSANTASFAITGPSNALVRQSVGSLTLNSNEGASNFNSGALIVQGGAGISGDVYVNGSFNVNGPENADISPAGGSVYIQPTLGGTVVIAAATEGDIDNMRIGQNNAADANFVNVDVQATTSATSTSSGALQVEGGVGIKGDIYARTGQADENYLLYTPKFTISTTAPSNPRIGDVWIDPTFAAYLVYVKDGTNKIWLQVGSA